MKVETRPKKTNAFIGLFPNDAIRITHVRRRRANFSVCSSVSAAVSFPGGRRVELD
jgi:hypothetical protein